ncbi:MAG: YdeI/OmpD-associated family protein [Opitutaceae bacterium]
MKRSTGEPSVTWPEAVAEALCVGWIDGIRRRVDDERYTIRFTPRRPRSNWSAVNIARAETLIRERRMQPAGLEAFAKRSAARMRTASYEKDSALELDAAELKRLQAVPKAWTFFQRLPPSHRRRLAWWVTSAKRPDTRERRFVALFEACAAERRLFG